MRIHAALLGLVIGTTTASCAFLLDFDELKSETGTPTGGTGGNDAGDSGAEVPLDQFAQRYAEALCKRLDRCLGPIAQVALGEDPCVDYFTKALGQSIFASLGELPAERFLYHPELVPACLSAVENADCDSLFPIPIECDAATEGIVAEGGDCTHPAECQRGFFCQSTSSCPGKCTKRPGQGEACASGTCLEGLQCDKLIGSGGAVSEVCLAPVAQELADCEGAAFASCRADMRCLGAEGATPGKCHKIESLFAVGIGIACNWAAPLCGKDLHCALDGAADGGDLFGGHCETTVSAGATCRLALPDMCPKGQYCNVPAGIQGVCEDLPVDGENCTRYSLKAVCAAGHRCVGRDEDAPDVTPGKCAALTALGYACKGDEGCYSGFCNNGKCAPPNYCVPVK